MHVDPCPYGELGGLLWVREAFAYVGTTDSSWLLYRAGDFEAQLRAHGFVRPFPTVEKVKWKPSIFMPRRVSRLTLRITDVRVQRVQDLSVDEILAEGVQIPVAADTGRPLMRLSGKHSPSSYLPNPPYPADIPEHDFMQAHWGALWGSANGRDAWKANPWVWALTFEVMRENVDDVLRQEAGK